MHMDDAGYTRVAGWSAHGVGTCAPAAQDSGPSVWAHSCIRVTNSLPPRRIETADRGTRSKVKYAQANSANIEAMAQRRRIGTPPDPLSVGTGPATLPDASRERASKARPISRRHGRERGLASVQAGPEVWR